MTAEMPAISHQNGKDPDISEKTTSKILKINIKIAHTLLLARCIPNASANNNNASMMPKGFTMQDTIKVIAAHT